MMTLSKSLSLLPLLFALSCSVGTKSQLKSEDAGRTELGLNDVAIMMPYEKRPELLTEAPTAAEFMPLFAFDEIRNILIDDEAIHEEEAFAFGVIGDKEFERQIVSLGAIEGPTPFRFVSMRIDPCGNSIGRVKTGEACHHEVRIVWQPLTLVDGKATTKDVNLHSIYHLDDKTFADFVNGMRSLRKAAGPAPRDEALMPHPIIEKQGLGGEYFVGLKKLLRTSLGPANLKRVAFFADTHPDFMGHWPLLAFNVEGDKVLRDASPTLGKAEGERQKLVQRIEGAPRRLGEPFPKGDFDHNLFPAFPEPEGVDESGMEAIYKTFLVNKYINAVQLENPLVHEPGNADCASCHMAAQGKFNVASELDTMGVNLPQIAFASDRWNLKSEVTASFSQTSLQIFSFFQSQSKIAPRAVHDAALSADHINQLAP